MTSARSWCTTSTTWDDAAVVEEFVGLGVGIGFAPDTLAEARNRGYDLARPGIRRVAAHAAIVTSARLTE